MAHDTPVFLQKLSVPRPSSGNLASLAEADRPIAVFSDFDGTIFLQDTGHVLFDEFGCGAKEREALDKSIGKTRTFREASEQLWGSLHVTLPDALAELKKKLVIDPDFYTFFEYLQAHNVPFTVISAGMKPLLRAALDEFLGKEKSAKVDIVSNDGVITPEGRWSVKWIHDSPLGHDKAKSVKEFRSSVDTSKGPPPKVVFIGDGVSDLAAASQADILFARRNCALEEYCLEHMIPYIPYDRFKDVLHDVKLLIKGNKFHDAEAAEAVRRAKLAKLTGGLAPLSGPSTKFGFGDASDDSEENSDSEYADSQAHPPRPHSPDGEPRYRSASGASETDRPQLSREASIGEVPQLPSAKAVQSLSTHTE